MVLLDTCVLLWLASMPARLSPAARKAIADNAGSVFVSAISASEIALKSAAGKLTLPKPPAEWYPAFIAHHGVDEIAVTGAIAIAAAGLPRLHSDPADRLLIATAIQGGMALVTPDAHIAQYQGVHVIW